MTIHVSPLFDELEPFNTGMLKVSDMHSLYYEESGNPQGVPVLFLHGGPGACCSPKNRRRFDPDVFRIVMFDQRGCGQSTPNACLEENTTQHLVLDINALRLHLGIEKWMVTGGSWGSTLALVYAVEYPSQVTGLVLNGIFLGYQVNVEWLHGPHGVARIFPEAYDDYLAFLPEDERGSPLEAYNKIINGKDKGKAIQAAVAMMTYEGKVMAMAENTLKEECERAEAMRLMTDVQKAEMQLGFERFAFTHSRLEGYYSENTFFLEEDYILDNIDKIKHIPTVLVHGRYDMVCPVKNAYKLHQYLPKSKLTIVPNAAHSTSEMMGEVMGAIKDMAKIVLNR